MALVEADITTNYSREDSSYLQSCLCEESIVDGLENPLLRRLTSTSMGNWTTIFDSPHYHPVKTNIVYDLDIYITTGKEQLASFLRNTSTVTLHFKSFPFFLKMDVTKMYIPNPQKWLNLYKNKSTGNMDSHSMRQHGGNIKIGGSLMSQSKPDVVPIESSKAISEQKSTDNLRLDMVAPTKQAVDEAKTVMRRVRKQIKINGQ